MGQAGHAVSSRRLRRMRELQGWRYNRETLEVNFRGRNIAEVLDMTVSEAIAFLASILPFSPSWKLWMR